jgi:hypothetical protein
MYAIYAYFVYQIIKCRPIALWAVLQLLAAQNVTRALQILARCLQYDLPPWHMEGGKEVVDTPNNRNSISSIES